MKHAVLAIAFLMSSAAFGQAVVFNWAKKIGGQNNDYSNAIATDGSGNVYTTGYFKGNVDFDPGPGSYSLSSLGTYDMFISKLDASGNFVWAYRFGDAYTAKGTAISTDATGNVYATGVYKGTIDFDPGPGVYTVSAGGGDGAFTLKLNAAGNLVWAGAIIGSAGSYGNAICTDAAGNVYTAGQFVGGPDFDPGAGVYNLTSAGSNDSYVSKLDASGNFVWAARLGGPNYDLASSVAVDATGNVFTTGLFNTTADFDPGPGVANLTTAGFDDVFISKLDASGNYAWALRLGGTNGDIGCSIGLDASGNIYTSGNFGGTTDLDPGAGTYNLTSAGSADVFISKLDASGNFIWAKQVGGTADEFNTSLSLSASGESYLTGSFYGTTDFNPGTGIFNLTTSGNADVFILKLSALGNFVWAKKLGGPSNDAGNGITHDASGNVYTTGSFSGTSNYSGDASAPFTMTASATDCFIQKMGLCTAPPSPTNTTLPANQVICSGRSATLTASSTGTVVWYPNATSSSSVSAGPVYVTSTLSPGTYTFYGESLTCTVSATRTPFTVTANPLPTLTVVSSETLLCAGNTVTLSAGGGVTYTWEPSGGPGDGIVVTPTDNVTYTITGIGANGCTNTTIFTQNVDPCAGLGSYHADAVLSFYPNPGAGRFTIELNREAHVTVQDALGRILFEEQLRSGTQTLNLEEAADGVYYLLVSGQNRQTAKKIVVFHSGK